MKIFATIRKNADNLLLAFSLLILPGLLFAVCGVYSLLTPCHVSTLAPLSVMLFFFALVSIGLGVMLIVDDWKK